MTTEVFEWLICCIVAYKVLIHSKTYMEYLICLFSNVQFWSGCTFKKSVGITARKLFIYKAVYNDLSRDLLIKNIFLLENNVFLKSKYVLGLSFIKYKY